MADIVQVTGLRELGLALDKLPLEFSKKIMRGALHAAGQVIADAAASTAPVRTGALQEDIITRVYVSPDLSRNEVKIGPGYDRSKLPVRKRGKNAGKRDTTASPGVYGKFVEEGHATAGLEKPRAGKDLELGSHDVAPHPWLRPAFEASKEQAVKVFAGAVEVGLAAVVAAVRKSSE